MPEASASGRPPSSAAIVVIMIGRKRSSEAWKIASSGDLPCSRCASSAKSIIMIAFFFTMPMRSTMPMSATMPRSWPVATSARMAPMPADGSVERIVSGWMKLSYRTPSTM